MWRPGVSTAVFLVLLAGAIAAPAAAAANVANPNPALIERWEPCEPNTGVTVIVDDQGLGAGKVYVGCALGEQADGVEALQNAGFALEGTAGYGLAFICRIDGEPTPTETPCTTTPGGGAYWSYWRGKPGGRWSFSGVGAKSPQSHSPVNSVEGWSFGGGGAPRIEPMDGSGPSSFSLPPPQESSVIAAALAREWLAPVLDQTAELAEQLEAEGREPHAEAGQILPGVLALARAGAEPAKLSQIAAWLARGCEEKHVLVEGCPLRALANPRERKAEGFALAVLGVQALGRSPESFAGRDLREELEELVSKSTGEVKSEGSYGADIEVTAPTVLALARSGALSAKALKTVGLILSQQSASTGDWETTTQLDVQAIEALVAAREQGAGALGQSLLERVDTALSEAGEYLQSIQEGQGGVREAEGGGSVDDPSVKSTALGAVGLALSGRQTAAELAAKRVSQFQVTAEYAGTGDPDTGEQTPAEDVIGAFLPSESALRGALAYGVKTNAYGLYYEAQAPTADALLALATAGPYGPYDAAFDEQSLLFEDRVLGSPGSPRSATLTNRDVRPVTIASIALAGADPADFTVAGGSCAGSTLQPGESCELSASFDPSATGLREALLQVTLAGTTQTIELALTGAGTSEPESGKQSPGQSGSQGVLGTRSASPVRVQAPQLDSLGAARGLVGVSWRVIEPGVGLSSWTISARRVGVRGASYVAIASGGPSSTSALLRLPAGAAYELQIAFTDALGRVSTTQIGEALVPYGVRWSGLRYRGRWRQVKQAGAWLGSVEHAGAGAQVTATLGAGRPVFLLRAMPAAATVEVHFGSHRRVFAIAGSRAGALRQITAAARSTAGPVSLLVLKGTVDLDGVAVEG
jgi:hypothetical protein